MPWINTKDLQFSTASATCKETYQWANLFKKYRFYKY